MTIAHRVGAVKTDPILIGSDPLIISLLHSHFGQWNDKMKKNKKSKINRIRDAIDTLNKIIGVEDSDIQINLHGGFERNPESVKFLSEIKDFIRIYKEFYKIDDVEVDFIL